MPLNPCVLRKNVVRPVNVCRQLHPVLFSTWKWKKGAWFAESRWAAHLRCDTCHDRISGRLKSNQFYAWGGRQWAGTSPQSPLPWGQKAAPNRSSARRVAASWAHQLLTLFIRLQWSAQAQEPTTCSLYNRKHLLLWTIINRRLLKELTLQQDPLNIYILRADVQQGVFTAEAAPTMLDGGPAHSTRLCCICHSRGSTLENRLPRSSFCLNCPSSSFAKKPPVFFPPRTQLSHHLKCLRAAPTRDWMQLCPPRRSLPKLAEIIHCNR